MQKHNLLAKKLKKQILSINVSIESYFNNLKNFKLKSIKAKFDSNYKLFWGIGAFVILTISYFLAPTAYDKPTMKQMIKNQILNRYNIDIKFNEKITYALLPRPHFKSKNLSILENEKIIGNVKNFKIFISIDRLFSFDKFETKDLVLDKTEFSLLNNDFSFFSKLLETEPSKNEIIIKNSEIFFKDNDDDVIFICKILNGKFFYDSNNLQNTFSSKNEIFNIPFKIIIKNDKFNKIIFSKLNSKKIRLNLKNKIDYTNSAREGLLDILVVNKSTKLQYEFDKDSLRFNSKSMNNPYKGLIDFKPFYLSTEFNYAGLNLKHLLKDDSIFTELIKNEIFTNRNLNSNISLNVKDITNIDELNNLFLKINLQEGIIDLSKTNIMWKDDLKIELSESLLLYDENQINLVGKMVLNFKNINDFYKSFQIKKNARKEIDQIQLDFNYNFDKRKITFDNVKINDKPNLKIQKFIDKFNSNENTTLNKILFKNFVNSFFIAYAG
tara:strand:- start:12 stop:1502 length:1491 start_codon:yes stop_codon:yes gene_type:complete